VSVDYFHELPTESNQIFSRRLMAHRKIDADVRLIRFPTNKRANFIEVCLGIEQAGGKFIQILTQFGASICDFEWLNLSIARI
jgi:hypothetical protein